MFLFDGHRLQPSGGMVISSAKLFQEAFAWKEVRAWSYGGVDRVLEPCVGEITRNGFDVDREP